MNQNISERLSQSQNETEDRHCDAYTAPCMNTIGRTVDIIQQNGSGHLRDGTGGWYVWGS